MIMKKEDRNNLKNAFEHINKLIESGQLSPREIEKLSITQARLAGALMSSWLPADNGRKFIMFVLLIVATYSLMQSAYIVSVISLIILCTFSPRVMGEVTIFIGKLKRNKN